jgi:hypothetical protein
MTMTMTNDHIRTVSRAHNFVFRYRSTTKDAGTMWGMEGRTAHVLWIGNPLRNRVVKAYGFVPLNENIVRIFEGKFSNDAKGSWWHGFETGDHDREFARDLYAGLQTDCTPKADRATIVVPHNPQFV